LGVLGRAVIVGGAGYVAGLIVERLQGEKLAPAVQTAPAMPAAKKAA
jgi:hypothetical protein